MSYKKIFVDNVNCSRRFHISFDDENTPEPKVELKCPFCDYVIFSAENHPPVELARQENLIQKNNLASLVKRECHFKDTFSPAPKV